jgi:hypothetical protein
MNKMNYCSIRLVGLFLSNLFSSWVVVVNSSERAKRRGRQTSIDWFCLGSPAMEENKKI